jgi:hypothetical protein
LMHKLCSTSSLLSSCLLLRWNLGAMKCRHEMFSHLKTLHTK